MPRLITAFLRHGDYKQLKQVPSALQPFELSSVGQEQAKSGAEIVDAYCQEHLLAIDSVVNCSTLLRAWQTAFEIKSKLEIENEYALSIDAHNDLCERSVGSVANLTVEQIESILKLDPRYELPPRNWKSDSFYCLPFQGAESLIDSGQRVAKHIETTLSQIKSNIHQDTLKIFVGHGASFRHAAYHLKLLKFEQISQLSLFHAKPLFIEFHDDHSFQHVDGDWKIRHKEEKHMD